MNDQTVIPDLNINWLVSQHDIQPFVFVLMTNFLLHRLCD